ncbi:hypothetical protein [Streptomyces capparidis]
MISPGLRLLSPFAVEEAALPELEPREVPGGGSAIAHVPQFSVAFGL